MRIVVGVDWEDPGQWVLEAVLHLYAPQELVLVHAVTLELLESYQLVPMMPELGHVEIRQAKQALLDENRQRLNTSISVPPDVPSTMRVCEIGPPARLILDTVHERAADLVAVGKRGLGQLAELMMGSVSHRVLMHARCSTLIIKQRLQAPQRVLTAVKGPDDAQRLQNWLIAHPFKHAVELSVMTVVPEPGINHKDLFPHWRQAATRSAEEVVQGVAMAVHGPHYRASARVVSGHPENVLAEEAAQWDLLVVSSHGHHGINRFLLGSISHALAHRVACPILIVR